MVIPVVSAFQNANWNDFLLYDTCTSWKALNWFPESENGFIYWNMNKNLSTFSLLIKIKNLLAHIGYHD